MFIISEEELNEFFSYYDGKITSIEKEIIRLKHIKHMENKDIATIVNKTLLEVNAYVKHFNSLYYNYMVRDVVLTKEDVECEILRHKSESIWTEEYKKIASFCFGVKCEYNPTGLKLDKNEIMEKMGYNNKTYYNVYTNIIKLLKARKINFIKPDNNYILREKLNELLNDVHLPIKNEK